MDKRTINGVEVRSADNIEVYFCDSCHQPHLILRDEHNRPFAEAVLPDGLVRLIAEHRKHLT
jgi:hypothetical protein